MPKRKLKMTKHCIAARKRYRAKRTGGNIIRKMFKWTQPVFSTIRRSTLLKKNWGGKRRNRASSKNTTYRGKRGGGGVNWNRGRSMKTTYFRRNRQGKRRAVKAPAGWPGS